MTSYFLSIKTLVLTMLIILGPPVEASRTGSEDHWQVRLLVEKSEEKIYLIVSVLNISKNEVTFFRQPKRWLISYHDPSDGKIKTHEVRQPNADATTSLQPDEGYMQRFEIDSADIGPGLNSIEVELKTRDGLLVRSQSSFSGEDLRSKR